MKNLIKILFVFLIYSVTAQNIYDKHWFESEKKPSTKIITNIDFDLENTHIPRPTFPENINEWIPKNYTSKKLFTDYSRRCKKPDHENGFTIINKDKFDAVVNVFRLRGDKHMLFSTFYLKPDDQMSFEHIQTGKYKYRVELGSDWKECRMDGREYRMFTKNRRLCNERRFIQGKEMEPYSPDSSTIFNIYKCNHKTIVIKNSTELLPSYRYNNSLVFNTINSPK